MKPQPPIPCSLLGTIAALHGASVFPQPSGQRVLAPFHRRGDTHLKEAGQFLGILRAQLGAL